MKIYFVFLLSIALCSISFLKAEPINWDAESRPQIRQNLNCAQFFLVPSDTKNDSVGIPLTQKVEELGSRLDQVIKEKGPEYLDKSQLILTGIEMGKEKETKLKVEAILEEKGLKEKIRVRIFSVPIQNVKWMSTKIFKAIWQQTVDFFPNIEKDYQTPNTDEIVTGLVSTAAVEAANVWYLYRDLPLLEANLTVSIHAATLAAYTVYTKSMVNWLLRAPNRVNQFLRQMCLSFPFILNYNLSANASKIVEYLQTHTWEETSSQFGTELVNFGSTQTITMLLQTLFYNVVITGGVRGWQNSRTGATDSDNARAVANIITAPILAADAVFLMYASAPSSTPFEFNSGHLALSLLTAGGSTLYFFPKLMDPFLPMYDYTKKVVLSEIELIKMAMKSLTGFLRKITGY